MKIRMINEFGNCIKIAENENQVYELEKIGFKPYQEPKEKVQTEKPQEHKARKKAVRKDGK